MPIHRALLLLAAMMLSVLPSCAEQAAGAAAGASTSSSQTATSTAGAATSTGAATTASAGPADPSATATAAAAPPGGPAAPEGMVRIPAGIFLMGAHAALGNPEEKPAHEAAVASFFLDKTEVTMAAYQRCAEAGSCEALHSSHRFCNAKLEDRSKHPANCVTLGQADAYCRWAGRRLPTEREWEYAATGGAERRLYSWGNDKPTDEIACYDHPGGSCAVASFEPGAFGLYDMNGNVWEWTASAFEPYPSRAKAEPIVATKRYVYRGGSWSRRFPKWLRNMLRNRYKPDKFSASIGMRCAKSIEPLQCPADTELRDGDCVRVRGTVLCEPNYAHDGKGCVPDVAGLTAKQHATWPPSTNTATKDLSQLNVPQAGPDAKKVTEAITRSRTAQHDADCAKHWPGYPASYLFKGGPNFPSRMPALRAGGCVPRDMGWSWTSACCKQ